MDKPVVTNEYAQGQMMGMLVIIQLIENAFDNKKSIPSTTFENIKRVAVESLAEYLEKPEEDVILLVNEQLRNI